MEQKRVSFKVVKAIKKAGYPIIDCDLYQVIFNQAQDRVWVYTKEIVNSMPIHDIATVFPYPTYLDVWLWLWREKSLTKTDVWENYINDISNNYIDPEKVIIAAIEYLVDNNLIK